MESSSDRHPKSYLSRISFSVHLAQLKVPVDPDGRAITVPGHPDGYLVSLRHIPRKIHVTTAYPHVLRNQQFAILLLLYAAEDCRPQAAMCSLMRSDQQIRELEADRVSMTSNYNITFAGIIQQLATVSIPAAKPQVSAELSHS